MRSGEDLPRPLDISLIFSHHSYLGDVCLSRCRGRSWICFFRRKIPRVREYPPLLSTIHRGELCHPGLLYGSGWDRKGSSQALYPHDRARDQYLPEYPLHRDPRYGGSWISSRSRYLMDTTCGDVVVGTQERLSRQALVSITPPESSLRMRILHPRHTDPEISLRSDEGTDDFVYWICFFACFLYIFCDQFSAPSRGLSAISEWAEVEEKNTGLTTRSVLLLRGTKNPVLKKVQNKNRT